jgi:hypothetical protein
MRTIKTICPDFEEWSSRWMGIEEDLAYGNKVLEVIRPFVESLVNSDMTDRKLKKYFDYLWLFGGEIIRDVSMNNEYDRSAIEVIKELIGPLGGPSCRHLHSDQEQDSYDKVCAELSEFLNNYS